MPAASLRSISGSRWREEPARDASAGLTVTRLANGNGVISFAGTDYQCGRGQPGTAAA